MYNNEPIILLTLPLDIMSPLCYNINKIREAENPKPQKGIKDMTKTEMKKLAKELLINKLSIAYYSLENSEYDHYSDEEKLEILQYINQYGKSMAKAIGEKYFVQ